MTKELDEDEIRDLQSDVEQEAINAEPKDPNW